MCHNQNSWLHQLSNHSMLQDSGYTSLGSVYAEAYGPAIEMMNAVGENAMEYWGNQLTQ